METEEVKEPYDVEIQSDRYGMETTRTVSVMRASRFNRTDTEWKRVSGWISSPPTGFNRTDTEWKQENLIGVRPTLLTKW